MYIALIKVYLTDYAVLNSTITSKLSSVYVVIGHDEVPHTPFHAHSSMQCRSSPRRSSESSPPHSLAIRAPRRANNPANRPTSVTIHPALESTPNSYNHRPIDGGKRKEILYGPYAVAPGEMITTYEYNTDSPCQNCYVTGMDVSLKYLDGREAKTSEGAWLHHVVMTRGSYRLLSTALASISPGIIWGAANERPVLRLNGKWKYGIDWPDVFSFTLDIMSEQKEEMNVYLAVTFEYIEKESNMGKQYKASSMYWHQVGEPEPIPGTTTYRSTPWRSDVDAKLLHAAGNIEIVVLYHALTYFRTHARWRHTLEPLHKRPTHL